MTERQSRTGRRRYRTREEAEQVAAEFEASGLTREEFCERNEVTLNSLARYVRKRLEGAGAAVGFVPVEIASTETRVAELSVLLRGARRVEVRRGFDTATLQQLIAALERF